ncbi:hypothetical protein [Phycicoccus sp. Root101]|uniref:hypothetical protein n=1 Tax=Phycicoccus sp. Root101 TaxID=1736421 RepID=UPI0007039B34|nr:hypothetical protein [Phycicoccus sp. Root101]KQU67567.1 hypothetical protein ASC58_13575 [Phycicoccus sp. Root101]
MSTDIQLAQRSSAELIGGAFVAIPAGLFVHLVTRGEDSRFYPAAAALLVLLGWTLLGVGLVRIGAKVDDLYRARVTGSTPRD